MQEHDGDVLANDRRGLEQLLVIRGQPLDPGRQDHLHGSGDLDALDRPGQTIRAALAAERARFHEGLDALFDEERVAAFDEQPRERRQRRIVAEERTEEVAGRPRGERVEPELTVVRLGSPTMLVLGSIVHQ